MEGGINLQEFQGENRRGEDQSVKEEKIKELSMERGEIAGREIRTYEESWSVLRALPPKSVREK
jgi:hypothetical protein